MIVDIWVIIVGTFVSALIGAILGRIVRIDVFGIVTTIALMILVLAFMYFSPGTVEIVHLILWFTLVFFSLLLEAGFSKIIESIFGKPQP